jgi:hypothetical protein
LYFYIIIQKALLNIIKPFHPPMKTTLYSIIIALVFSSCGNKAKEYNEQFNAIEKQLKEETISDFASATTQFENLKTLCQEEKAKIEFDEDAESKFKTQKLTEVLTKIEVQLNALKNEEKEYQEIQNGTFTDTDKLRKLSTFLSSYPNGIKHQEIKHDFSSKSGALIDELSNKLNEHLTGLPNEPSTDDNLYRLVNFTASKMGEEPVEYTEVDYIKAVETFNVQQSRINDIVSVVEDVVSANGNSPQSLRKQYEQYKNQLSRIKTEREASIRGAVAEALINQGWESEAQREIEMHIARERGGFFSSCDARDLQNTITKAQENVTTIFSDKVDVILKYKVNSYCSNGKYKYYDATFTLRYPVIGGKLGTGFFENKTISRTD